MLTFSKGRFLVDGRDLGAFARVELTTPTAPALAGVATINPGLRISVVIDVELTAAGREVLMQLAREQAFHRHFYN